MISAENTTDLLNQANTQGTQGWELAGVVLDTSRPDKYVGFLKRKKQSRNITVSTQPEATAEKSGKKGLHCDDPPPANPANCTLGIDQPFSVDCNPPFAGAQSH